MLGKALPYFLINAVVAEFYLRVLFPLNDIPMEGSWLVAIPFTFLFVMTMVTWGMWVSGFCRTRLFATQALMFVAMPSPVLSGFTWPASGMTWFPRFLGQLLPMTYFVTSFRNIYLANAPFEFVAGSVAALLGFLALNIVLALVVIRWLVHKTVGVEAAPPVTAETVLQPS
jgi:ABC-2 type transport system permease protein